MSNERVRVWDPLVRVFHWSLVAAFALAYLTGDEESRLHVYSGYAVLGLVLIRVAWGFVGTRHARFSDFVYGPARVVAYLKSLLSPAPERFLGHTPAGGWMILALLGSLMVTGLTGLQVYGLEGHGPLAAVHVDMSPVSSAGADEDDDDERAGGARGSAGEDTEASEHRWEEVHEFFANFTLLLIFIHVAAVVVTGRLHKENLVKAMITGDKGA